MEELRYLWVRVFQYWRLNSHTRHYGCSIVAFVHSNTPMTGNDHDAIARQNVLRFPFTCTTSHPHYSSFLSHWTIHITMDY